MMEDDEMTEAPLDPVVARERQSSTRQSMGIENSEMSESGEMPQQGFQEPGEPAPIMSPGVENVSAAQDLVEELVLIDHQNYALHDDVVKRFEEDILSKLALIEDQRAPLEDLWGECEDIWLRKNNAQSRYYTGINDAYMPTAFRAL